MNSSAETNRFPKLDPLVHEKGKLAILTYLTEAGSAEYTFLLRLTNLPTGTISRHMRKLEEAGLIRVDKEFVHRRPKTTLTITNVGKSTVDEHWQKLQYIKDNAGRIHREEEQKR